MMTLIEARNRLRSGYAHDLLVTILQGKGDLSDPDCLFRTLVLDQSWSVETAKDIYNQAVIVVEAKL
jgi:hypothetical protein